MKEDLKRLSRLTAILIQLLSKNLVTAPSLAEKFGVTVRTIYRDMKALEQAGIPLLTEEGKGYSIMEGYKIPPVMFTEREALALITAEQIIQSNKDASFVKEFTAAVAKIKSVMRALDKEKMAILEQSIYIGKNSQNEKSSHILMNIQVAITTQKLINIRYHTEKDIASNRTIEPYLVYHSVDDNWVLAAYCRLRGDFRSFRLDRIESETVQSDTFIPNYKGFKKYIEEKFLTPPIPLT